MIDSTLPGAANRYHQAHVNLLLDSYRRLLNKPLLDVDDPLTRAQAVFDADFALLSHTGDSDPVFNYGNRTALRLFELSWQELVILPSRFSAEPVNREERKRLLMQVSQQGYIDRYAGVRISKSGRRFMISNAVVWNVHDSNGRFHGQAACFADWEWLD